MSAKKLYEFDTAALVRSMMHSAGITKGLWRFATKYRLANVVGHFGQADGQDANLAAVIAGLDRAALIPEDQPGDMVFDAAVLLADASVSPQALPLESSPAVKTASAKKTASRKTAPKKG